MPYHTNRQASYYKSAGCLCAECGALVRPNVVLFDEALPLDSAERLQDAIELGFDMAITIGTSGVLPHISWPVIQAEESGMFTAEINPGKTKLSKQVGVHLEMGAAQARLAIIARLYTIHK